MIATKKWVLLLIIILLSSVAYGQVADSTYFNRLYYTAKVWGHVKYYHTSMQDGSVDWDEILLDSIDGFKSAPDNISFNDSLLQMINQAGPMGTHSTSLPNVPDSLNNNADMAWIYDPIFSEPVRTILDTIGVRFRPQNNIYIGEMWDGGPPSFNVDNKFYEIEGYPDEDLRILALFRYWNIINYFFPYKYIMDQDWDVTLIEFIPKIVHAPDALAYQLVFKELTTRINDSHAFFSSPVFWEWHGLRYPPFHARIIEEQMVITKVLPESGVAQGDIIKMIDNEDVEELRAGLRRYAHGSNEDYIERVIDQFILYGHDGEFTVTVSNNNDEKTVTSSRNSTNFSSLNSDDSPIWSQTLSSDGCNFGKVDMGRLERTQVASMFNDLWDTDAIIFDIRNYPNSTLWNIVNYLFTTSINIANFTKPDVTYPGRLFWEYEYIGSGTPSPYTGRIIILFDERTLSQAEYTVMGLEQFPGAIKIGSTTAAADGNAASIYLPGRIQTNATFLGVYYPNYSPTQRIGIIPDIELRPTIQGIRDLQDEVMNFALNCEVLDYVSEISEHEIVSLYPNPVGNNLNYELLIDKSVLIEVYDVLGRKLITINRAVPSGTIDISFLSSGVYFLKTTSDNTSQFKKFTKIK